MLPPLAVHVKSEMSGTMSPVYVYPVAVNCVDCLGRSVTAAGETRICRGMEGSLSITIGRQLCPTESHTSNLLNCRPTTSANRTGPTRTSIDSAPALKGTSE